MRSRLTTRQRHHRDREQGRAREPGPPARGLDALAPARGSLRQRQQQPGGAGHEHGGQDGRHRVVQGGAERARPPRRCRRRRRSGPRRSPRRRRGRAARVRTLSRSGAKMRNTGVATATPMKDPRLWDRRAKSASSAATREEEPGEDRVRVPVGRQPEGGEHPDDPQRSVAVGVAGRVLVAELEEVLAEVVGAGRAREADHGHARASPSDQAPSSQRAERASQGRRASAQASARRRSSLSDASSALPVESAQRSDAKAQAT